MSLLNVISNQCEHNKQSNSPALYTVCCRTVCNGGLKTWGITSDLYASLDTTLILWMNWPAHAHLWVFWHFSICSYRATKTFIFRFQPKPDRQYSIVITVLPAVLLILLMSWEYTIHSSKSCPPPNRITRNVKGPHFILLIYQVPLGAWVWEWGLSLSDQAIIPSLPSHNPCPFFLPL